MDTAQRGMGLDWDSARDLIARSLADAHGPSPAEPEPTIFPPTAPSPSPKSSMPTNTNAIGSNATAAA